MAGVSTVKAVKTRYRNTFEKEPRNARSLLSTDVSSIDDKNELLKSLQKSKSLLKSYSKMFVTKKWKCLQTL